MRFARTLIAVLVALSVAMLPAAGGLAMVQKQTETAVSEPMHDCCPGQQDKAMDCGSMAGCALKCFSFAPGLIAELLVPVSFASAVPLGANRSVPSQPGALPFRPPRA